MVGFASGATFQEVTSSKNPTTRFCYRGMGRHGSARKVQQRMQIIGFSFSSAE